MGSRVQHRPYARKSIHSPSTHTRGPNPSLLKVPTTYLLPPPTLSFPPFPKSFPKPLSKPHILSALTSPLEHDTPPLSNCKGERVRPTLLPTSEPSPPSFLTFESHSCASYSVEPLPTPTVALPTTVVLQNMRNPHPTVTTQVSLSHLALLRPWPIKAMKNELCLHP